VQGRCLGWKSRTSAWTGTAVLLH